MQRIESAPSGLGNRLMPTESITGSLQPSKRSLLAIIGPVCVVSLLVGLNVPKSLLAATRSVKQQVVPNWALFEQVYFSTRDYTNPLQEATLTAVFTSPEGNRRMVNGFWDGGRVWRVRFCPDVPGQWTFTSFCSDPENAGLSGQTGHFLCTAPLGDSVFRQHGPIRVARDHTHFEHTDGTPFFWLADTAGPGAAVATLKDWQRYASVRSSQLFNVSVWDVGFGDDFRRESGITGFPERIAVNPQFFQRLDQKVETLSREGILSAIVPRSTTKDPLLKSLPDDQAALLLRYMVARWGEQPVAWILDSRSDPTQTQLGRWREIYAAVFTNSVHAPVVLRGSSSAKSLRDQSWTDALGLDAAAQPPSTIQGPSITPPGQGASLEATCPIVLFAPCENGPKDLSQQRFKADDVRHSVYQSLFLRSAAGVTYSARGVADWDTSVDPNATAGPGVGMPLWERALFMPGAKQMRALADLMSSIEFWRLRPRPEALANRSANRDRVVAASISAKDLTLVYLPQSGSVDVSLRAMPSSPLISWLEPRQGSVHSAVAVVSGSVCQFPPPGEGDWVLLIKSGK